MSGSKEYGIRVVGSMGCGSLEAWSQGGVGAFGMWGSREWGACKYI